MAEETTYQSGGISVQTEHIFPIIKKWLYSEKEIFLREIVSNACDAVTKLKRLSSLGVAKDIADDFRITVKIDKDAKTLTVTDNGIGMTKAEVEQYICQIALSGALDFIEKYESEGENKGGIIGHFGLGFYSAFMVSDTVEVVTKSYQDSPATHFVCEESGNYRIGQSDKASRGTDVIMHITDEEAEFLDEHKIRTTLQQYCSFMPIEIYLEVAGKEEKEEDKKPVNDCHPLWQKAPSDCTKEEYNEFYHKVFHDFRDPLFYIHLNADYPLNFKGVLYFPRLNHEYDNLEGQVKLYYNQVFVADNMKEVIPEYMLMLRGVLDCPELPLNVSRSYLQNNAYVAKVQAHIAKKVADKLTSLLANEREEYEKLWEEVKLFVEYGCMRDRKFYDRLKDALLLTLTDGSHQTVKEYLEAGKEKAENTVYYTTDPTQQAQYISMFERAGIAVARFDKMLDTQFISFLEQQEPSVKFLRVDAEVATALTEEASQYDNADLTALLRAVSGNEKLEVKYQNFKDESIPALLNLSEESRRMDDMMKMYRMQAGAEAGADFDLPQEMTLVLNAKSPLVQKLGEAASAHKDGAKAAAKQLYTLALLAQRPLDGKELQTFLQESYTLLQSYL